MFRKKVILFGRSVSLSLVLALVTVSVAAAFWGILVSTNLYVNSSLQNSVSAQTIFCDVLEDKNTGQQPTTCQPGGLGINIVQASPGDSYHAGMYFSAPATNTGNLYAQPMDVSGWAPTLDSIVDTGCGQVIPPGAANVLVDISFKFDVDGWDTNPGENYGPFEVKREFAATVPTCP